MKIAFAMYDRQNDVGGVSSWLQRLLPRLQAGGFEVEVHVFGSPGPNCAAFARLGIPYRSSPGETDTRKAVRNCLRLIAEGQPDVYVPNCIVPAYYAAGYARKQGIATVGVLHSDDPFYWGIVEEFIEGASAFRLSAVVAVSKFLQEAVVESTGKHNLVTRRIGCGVPLSNEVAKPANGVFRLVYTGRLEEEQKNISEVTRSLCEMVRRNPGVEAWIVGEGNARGNVERIIRESGVDPQRVRLLGRVEVSKIYAILGACHAFVLLSDFEGLPVSMLEAMAAGVVPVCLDMRSGIREAIQDGFNGLIVKDRQEGFYAAIETLQKDAPLWSKLSANARETIKAKFSEETCAAAWVELLGALEKKQCSAPFKLPAFIHLPRRNSKFGIYDRRSLPFSSSVSRLRIALGYYRRKLLKPFGLATRAV